MTPWTLTGQAPLSMESSRQEHWSELPFPSPRDLPDSVTEPGSLALKADSSPSEPYIIVNNFCSIHSYVAAKALYSFL